MELTEAQLKAARSHWARMAANVRHERLTAEERSDLTRRGWATRRRNEKAKAAEARRKAK